MKFFNRIIVVLSVSAHKYYTLVAIKDVQPLLL